MKMNRGIVLSLFGIFVLQSLGFSNESKNGLIFETPSLAGINSEKLLQMSKWIEADTNMPVFSIIISKKGKINYELYTGQISKEASHYMMSVTKSVLSLIVGCALDRGILSSSSMSLADLVPEKIFKEIKVNKKKFRDITLQEAMSMSVFDCPHDPGAEFFHSANRLRYVLPTKLVERPGISFCYNNQTPILVAGGLTYKTKKTVYEFGRDVLFGPLDFKNEEWMHQDGAGIECGGWGFRMRPLDMQKLGVLILNQGKWDGHQIVSEEWVAKSMIPIIKSKPENKENDYGWYWWTKRTQDGDQWLLADGRWGQRIAICKKQEAVVTMTGCFMHSNEQAVFDKVLNEFVLPALKPPVRNEQAYFYDEETLVLNNRINKQPFRGPIDIEERMIPTEKNLGTRKPLREL